MFFLWWLSDYGGYSRLVRITLISCISTLCQSGIWDTPAGSWWLSSHEDAVVEAWRGQAAGAHFTRSVPPAGRFSLDVECPQAMRGRADTAVSFVVEPEKSVVQPCSVWEGLGCTPGGGLGDIPVVVWRAAESLSRDASHGVRLPSWSSGTRQCFLRGDPHF